MARTFREAVRERDLLTCRLFLYKFHPTLFPSTEPTGINQFVQGRKFTTTQFTVPNLEHTDQLEDKYFHVIDISQFVASYNKDYSNSPSTPTWAVQLQNANFTSQELQSLFVNAPANPKSNFIDDFITRLSVYSSLEVSTTEFVEEPKRIKNAITSRAKQADVTFDINKRQTLSSKVIRLGDLIREGDLLVCMVFKDKEKRGIFREPVHDTPQVSISKLFGEGLAANVKKLGASSVAAELKLLDSGFEVEFMGFAHNVSDTSAPPEVEQVQVQGGGLMSLMEATRRFYDPGLLPRTVFEISEISGLDNTSTVTALQHQFANKSPIDIVKDILRTTYGLKTRLLNAQEAVAGASRQEISYIDLTEIRVRHALKKNLFTYQPYMIGQMFKRINYNVRDIIEGRLEATVKKAKELFGELSLATEAAVTSGFVRSPDVIRREIDSVLAVNSLDIFGTYDQFVELQPLVMESNDQLNSLRAYLIDLTAGFGDFTPGTRTPLEITAEVVRATQLEFFEKPNGVFMFRQPVYNVNDTRDINMLVSDDLVIMSTSPVRTLAGTLSRQKVSFVSDLGIRPVHPFVYTSINTKILMQYGLRESDVQENPNARFIATKNEAVDNNKINGMHAFADLVLQRNNYMLRTNTISVVGTPKLRPGMNFYDSSEFRIGYVTSISTSHSLGGSYTSQINTSFVRDVGALTPPSTLLNIKEIPILTVNVASVFATGNATSSASKPLFKSRSDVAAIMKKSYQDRIKKDESVRKNMAKKLVKGIF